MKLFLVFFMLQGCVAAFLDVVIGGRAVETPPMSSMNLLEGLSRTAVYITHSQLLALVRSFLVPSNKIHYSALTFCLFFSPQDKVSFCDLIVFITCFFFSFNFYSLNLLKSYVQVGTNANNFINYDGYGMSLDVLLIWSTLSFINGKCSFIRNH